MSHPSLKDMVELVDVLSLTVCYLTLQKPGADPSSFRIFACLRRVSFAKSWRQFGPIKWQLTEAFEQNKHAFCLTETRKPTKETRLAWNASERRQKRMWGASANAFGRDGGSPTPRLLGPGKFSSSSPARAYHASEIAWAAFARKPCTFPPRANETSGRCHFNIRDP